MQIISGHWHARVFFEKLSMPIRSSGLRGQSPIQNMEQRYSELCTWRGYGGAWASSRCQLLVLDLPQVWEPQPVPDLPESWFPPLMCTPSPQLNHPYGGNEDGLRALLMRVAGWGTQKCSKQKGSVTLHCSLPHSSPTLCPLSLPEVIKETMKRSEKWKPQGFQYLPIWFRT
jgi:hypothetical protein